LAVYVAKGSRVFVSMMLSILIPIYLTVFGYGGFFVGLALVAILAGNAVSNVGLTFFGGKLGRRRILQIFASLMVVSGIAFVLSGSPAVILVACFLGNISTTGTEVGPFQSVEAGVLPDLASGGTAVRAFGVYNVIGYVAASVGAFAAGTPGYLGYSLLAFQGLFGIFALVGVLLFLTYSRLRGLDSGGSRQNGPSLAGLSTPSKREVTRLASLFSIDAFGGSFVSQYILTYWFLQTYSVSGPALGGIFFVSNVIAGASIYGAARIAGSVGNLRTMFYSHVASNAFLILIPFAGSLVASLAFFFLRQSLSQMDVPTRQALMAEIFPSEERVAAYALTNATRSGGAFVGGPFVSIFLASGFLSAPLLVGGFSKLVYDFAIFGSYRKRFR
jgi:MFS family permease